jgi:hypothetical protein
VAFNHFGAGGRDSALVKENAITNKCRYHSSFAEESALNQKQ